MKILKLLAVLGMLSCGLFAQHTELTGEDAQTITGAKTFKNIDGSYNAVAFSGADIHAQTNAALAVASAGTTPCRVKIPPAIYAAVTTTLNMVSNCVVDAYGAQFTYTGTGKNVSFCGTQHAQLKGGQWIGTQTVGTTGIAMGCTTANVQTAWNSVQDVALGGYFGTATKGFDNGVSFDGTSGNNGTYFNDFFNVTSNVNLNRGVLCKPTSSNYANENHFWGGAAQLNGLDGVKIDGCAGMEFHAFDSENNNQNAAAAVNISTITRAGTVVTVNTSTAINCVAGDVVKITGVIPSDYNSVGVPTQTCPSSTSFTYNQNFQSGVAASGSGGTAARGGCGWNLSGIAGSNNGDRIIGGWSETNTCDVAIGSNANVNKLSILGTTVNATGGASGQTDGILNNFFYGQGGSINDHYGPERWHASLIQGVGDIFSIFNDEFNNGSGERQKIFNINRSGADAGTLELGTGQYPVKLFGPLQLNAQTFTGTLASNQTATQLLNFTDAGPSGTLEMSLGASAIGAGSTFLKFCSTTTCGLATGTEMFSVRGDGAARVKQIAPISTGNMLISDTAPTIAGAGCGGSAATIATNNGTAAFSINAGTAPLTACTVTLPTATNGWNCYATDITTQSTSIFLQKQTATGATTATITNYNTAGTATNFVASDIIQVSCFAR